MINRYQTVPEKKSGGVTYTPKVLADFVARQIVNAMDGAGGSDRPLRILDPAVGHGELLISLLDCLRGHDTGMLQVSGFETDPGALDVASGRLSRRFPDVRLDLRLGNFLAFVLEQGGGHGDLFGQSGREAYDLVIANPPYVRTQVMGAVQAKLLARQFGLSGRVDLYHAFMLGLSRVLEPNGTAGIIVSNRFMTTRSGASVRGALVDHFDIRHVWDLGDTRVFDAAVLPAVLLARGRDHQCAEASRFTSIYAADETAELVADTPVAALELDGVVETGDGGRFRVRHGNLATGGSRDGVWRIGTPAIDDWLATVDSYRWGTFRDVGKIRVGVKTCADKIFIRRDWDDVCEAGCPELLRPLTTHHMAHRFRPLQLEQPLRILYPHEMVQGRRRPVALDRYPRSEAYLQAHRARLEGRSYVVEAGRAWYELWVPQDPAAWEQPKLVFRDIAEEPTFWIDLDGTVVNGDCYWMTCSHPLGSDLLWLAAAVGNSTFIEHFYDLRFHNKLYAGRRRFMTQYVEQFPLPDPHGALGRAIVAKARKIHGMSGQSGTQAQCKELDAMVWEALTGSGSVMAAQHGGATPHQASGKLIVGLRPLA